jgi:hypothetical protein
MPSNKKYVLIMKTVTMKPRFYITILMMAAFVSAHAQLTTGMLTLPTLNNANAGIEMKLKATACKNAGEVSWQSLKYIKIRRYELEKGSDGINFSYVTAKPGNINAQDNYTVKDEYLFEGINYYRLKIVDQKGNFNYSKIASFDRKAIAAEIKIMPAIADDELYIWLPVNTQISKASITDVMGRGIIENATVTNLTNLASLPVTNLAAGMYQINILTSTGITANLKFSKK